MHRSIIPTETSLRRPIIAAIVCAAASCAPIEPAANDAPVAELAGRTRGTPQNCVSIRQGNSLRVVDRDTVIYVSGRTVWVNDLRSECPGLRAMSALIVEPMGSQYCRGDHIRAFEPATRTPGPICVLGDFVPYAR